MGSDERHGGEWETVTIVIAAQRGHVVRIKTGVVRDPSSGGRRIAMQLDDRPVVIVSPASAARIIGALHRAMGV